MSECILCFTTAPLYFTDENNQIHYFRCLICDLIFLDPIHRLNSVEEHARYELHQNEVSDVTYQNYMKPFLGWINQRYPPQSHGLDFGCGKGPVLAQMLSEQDYNMSLYDPFYFPDTSYANNKFDFIVATEVFEHFYSPKKELQQLHNLLLPNGGLGIVTALHSEKINFRNWHYRRDPTHVCFYSANTFDWIKINFNFTSYQTDGKQLNWLML